MKIIQIYGWPWPMAPWGPILDILTNPTKKKKEKKFLDTNIEKIKSSRLSL
jgi:hypothetical protein